MCCVCEQWEKKGEDIDGLVLRVLFSLAKVPCMHAICDVAGKEDGDNGQTLH